MEKSKKTVISEPHVYKCNSLYCPAVLCTKQYTALIAQLEAVTSSDVKFHEIFWREIFHKIFCIVHCNKVSKQVKGKYLLLCMNSIMYFLLTSYTLIMFL